MKMISIHIPEPDLQALDELVKKRYYAHRAEAIRIAIRNLIIEHKAHLNKKRERGKDTVQFNV